MVNFFSNWAEQIIIAVVITSIMEMILPDNKNKKYIKIVMGIYILFSIISPIASKKNLFSVENLNLESYVADNKGIPKEEVNQESMDERLQQLYVEELENNIKDKVEQEGYSVNSCKIDAVLYGEEEKQGINKINLVVSKKENEENGSNLSNESNIKSVNKVEINVGLDKYLSNDETSKDLKVTNSEVQNLKNTLSSYYEIESNKINISVK